MLRPQLILDISPELFVDNFAGGGGASTGIERALGRHVDHAINHNAEALGMHRINHPQTIHHCEDVFDVDPATVTEGRPVGGGWFSPDCKHFSKAKGGKPLSKKIRGLAFVILRWAKIRTRVIYMENVEEISTWGPLLADGKPDPAHRGRTWQSFLAALSTGCAPDCPDLDEMLEVLGTSVTRAELIRGFGYHVETRELRACDYGAPTIRKRLFLIARCDAQPIVWPEPTHFSPRELPAARRRLGRSAQPWRTVAECIDWNLPVNSIFLNAAEAKAARCRRPLAPATLRRIATGIDRYVLKAASPFLVSLTHQGGDRVESVNEPARVITGAHRGEKAGVDTTMAPFIKEHANASTQRTMPASEPLRTQCAQVKGGHFSLVSGTLCGAGGRAAQSRPRDLNEPLHTTTSKADTILAASSLVKLRGGVQTHPDSPGITEPAHTISAGGTHHGLSCAFLAQHNGGFNTNPGHAAQEPLSTVSSKGSQQQIVAGTLAAYYGNDQDGQGVDEPARTVTTRERFGFALSEAVAPVMTPEQLLGARRVAAFLREYGVQFEGEFATVGGFVIVDIGMRMLTARELFRAQGFPADYVIDQAWVIDPATGDTVQVALTKEQQIRMCGNSVCPPVAEAIVRANSADMAITTQRPCRSRRKSPLRALASSL